MKVFCSFCGRSSTEVWRIVKGDDCAICDRCVDEAALTLIYQRVEEREAEGLRAYRESVERDAWMGTGP